jgi:small GTP-binding protein
MNKLKTILVGESQVGKTSIITQYIRQSFDEEYLPTISADKSIKDLIIEKQPLTLEIWDTAGQEIYRSLSKNFYLNATIGILVYDICNIDTFNSIKEYWLEQLKESGDKNMILAIVGNKIDLFQNEQIPEQEARDYAKSVNAGFYLVSCKQRIGINELFEDVTKRYLELYKLTMNNNNNKEKENKKVVLNIKITKNKKKCC